MEIITKKGIILGEEDRNADEMAAFIFNKLLSTLERSKELLFPVYSFVDKDTLSYLEKKYKELISEEDRSKLNDIQAVHNAIVEKYGKTDGNKKMSVLFNNC